MTSPWVLPIYFLFIFNVTFSPLLDLILCTFDLNLYFIIYWIFFCYSIHLTIHHHHHHHGMDHFWPALASFQVPITLLMGLPGLLLPFGLNLFNICESLLCGILFTWFVQFYLYIWRSWKPQGNQDANYMTQKYWVMFSAIPSAALKTDPSSTSSSWPLGNVVYLQQMEEREVEYQPSQNWYYNDNPITGFTLFWTLYTFEWHA